MRRHAAAGPRSRYRPERRRKAEPPARGKRTRRGNSRPPGDLRLAFHRCIDDRFGPRLESVKRRQVTPAVQLETGDVRSGNLLVTELVIESDVADANQGAGAY